MKTKRIISLLAASVLLCSSVPTGVYAQNLSDNEFNNCYYFGPDGPETFDGKITQKMEGTELIGNLHVRDINSLEFIKDATEITDDEIRELYLEIEQETPYKHYVCRVCGAEKSKIFAYENVKYDNSTAEGKKYNSYMLKSQVVFQSCAPTNIEIYIDNVDSAEAKDILAYLNETYKPDLDAREYPTFDDSLDALTYLTYDGVIRALRLTSSRYHFPSMELAEEICADLKGKGYNTAQLYCCGHVNEDKTLDGKLADINESVMYYPETASSDIKRIISEFGIKADIIPFDDRNDIVPYPDDCKCITIDFPDVESTTQMDVVKLRTAIYKITGLKGINDDPLYTPLDESANDNNIMFYDSNSYKSEEVSSGDINSDGKVDVTDLSELALALVGDKELTESQQKAADVDSDGAVKLADLAKVRQYLSKVISSLG